MAKKIILKNAGEIELMRQSAQLVSKTLGMLAEHVVPGAIPTQLDALAETFIRDNGGVPGFKGLYDCPSTLLISPNEVVVHGLPTDKPLEEGDIVSIDCGVLMNEFYGDHAYCYAVGEIAEDVAKLMRVTKESLYLGIAQARHGNRVGDIGYAIQRHCESHGYSVVRDFVGHGLGRSMHESPEVPNFGKRGTGKLLRNGTTLAIEPMINMGNKEVRMKSDKWTVVTKDKKPSVHYEHDVAIWDGEPVILSTFDYVEDALGIARSTPVPKAVV